MTGRCFTRGAFAAIFGFAVVVGPQLAAGTAAAGEGGKRWTINLSIGLQHDNNVTTDEVDNVSNLSDEAAVIDLSGTYKAYDGPGGVIELGYDFFQSFYDKLTDFDLNSHTFSISGKRQIGEFDTGLLYLYSRTLLDGKDFLGIHSIAPNVGYAVTPELYLSGRYNFQDKDFISSPGRDGRQHAASIDAFFFFMNNTNRLNL